MDEPQQPTKHQEQTIPSQQTSSPPTDLNPASMDIEPPPPACQQSHQPITTPATTVDDSFPLQIARINFEQSYSVTVRPTDTIDSVKKQLLAHESTPQNKWISFIINKKQFDLARKYGDQDDRNLAACGITPSTTIQYLLLTERNQWQRPTSLATTIKTNAITTSPNNQPTTPQRSPKQPTAKPCTKLPPKHNATTQANPRVLPAPFTPDIFPTVVHRCTLVCLIDCR